MITINGLKNKYCYSEKDLIGEGNFSYVYKGYMIGDDVKVAVKKLKSSEKIEREIEIFSKISHKNLIEMYDIIKLENAIYIVMEYCGRGTIGGLERPMVEKKWKKYFRQIVDGLYYLYRNNIYHRDLKLDNILLDDEDVIKICDFTFTREFKGDEILKGTLCGTPLYVAPEILNGKYDKRSDIWSLGIIMYEFIYGQYPFKGVTMMNLCKVICGDQIQYPRRNSKNDHVSDAAISIMTKMLRRRSAERIDWEELNEHDWWRENNNFIKMPSNVIPSHRSESVPMCLYTFGGPPVLTTFTPPIDVSPAMNRRREINVSRIINIAKSQIDIGSEYNPIQSSCPLSFNEKSNDSISKSNSGKSDSIIDIFKSFFG